MRKDRRRRRRKRIILNWKWRIPIKEKKINRKFLTIIAIIFSIFINAYFSVSLHFILSKNFNSLFNINILTIINTLINEKRVFIIFCAFELIIITLLLLFSNRKKNIYHSNTIKLTNKIEVPVPIRWWAVRYILVVR